MTAALVAIIIAVLEAVVSGLFNFSKDSSKGEAETARKRTEAILDVTDAERSITDVVREVERAGVRPENVFAPELPGSPVL